MIHTVSKQYRMVWYCLQYNHSFHFGHDRYYVRNHRLTPEQEVHILSLMEVSESAEGVSRYVRKKFNRLVTVNDRTSPRRKFGLIGCLGDVVRVKDLLQGQYWLSLLRGVSIVRCIFCTSRYGSLNGEIPWDNVNGRHPAAKLRRSILWHAKLIDDNGLGRSLLYALLPNESGTIYCRMVTAIKNIFLKG